MLTALTLSWKLIDFVCSNLGLSVFSKSSQNLTVLSLEAVIKQVLSAAHEQLQIIL